MLKKLYGSLLLLILLLGLAGCGGEAPPATEPEAPDGDAGGKYGEYLTVADVEEITGLTGVTTQEEDFRLQFYNDAGANILDVRFKTSDFYEDEVTENLEYYTEIPDIGEKAAIAIPDAPYRITFVKGEHAVMVQTVPGEGGTPLTEEQLIAAARILAERM